MKIDTKLILNMLTGKAEQETLDYVLQEISFYKPTFHCFARWRSLLRSADHSMS